MPGGCRAPGCVAYARGQFGEAQTYLEPALAKTVESSGGCASSRTDAAHAALENMLRQCNAFCARAGRSRSRCRAFALPPAGQKILPGACGRTTPWRNWSANTRRNCCWRSPQKIFLETSWNSESTRDGGPIFCGRLQRRSGCAEGSMDSTVLKDCPSRIRSTIRRYGKEDNTRAGSGKSARMCVFPKGRG